MFRILLAAVTMFCLFSSASLAQEELMNSWPEFTPYDNSQADESATEWEFSLDNVRYQGMIAPKRFLSVDRFADKYPSLSPYQYTANNPINFIDVNGDSIWIEYLDNDGNDQRLLYTQGMAYEGDNQQIAGLVNSLNLLNSVQSGNTILSQLTGSAAHYNLGVSGQYGGAYNGNALQQGSGGNIGIANPGNVTTVAHELFHGYQHEFMDMTNSTALEVGGHLFEQHISSQIDKNFISPYGGDEDFNNAFTSLLLSPSFNQEAFNTATRTFLQSSFNPPDPPNYNHLQPIIINNPVISRFYPLIQF